MIKNILNLGSVLNKSEQQTIVGGNNQDKCFKQYTNCSNQASQALTNSLNDCVLGSGSCIADAAFTYGDSITGCQNTFNSCNNQ